MAANTPGATTGKTANGAGTTKTKGAKPLARFGNIPMAAAITGYTSLQVTSKNGAPNGTNRILINATKQAN